MHSTYEQFLSALRTPSERATIGLIISDDDAGALLSNDEWARGYFDQWVALAPEVIPTRPADAETPAHAEEQEPDEKYEDEDEPRRWPRLLVKACIALLIIGGAFTAGAATALLVTGVPAAESSRSDQVQQMPQSGGGGLSADVTYVIERARPCGPANIGVTVTTIAGDTLQCTVAGETDRWLPPAE